MEEPIPMIDLIAWREVALTWIQVNVLSWANAAQVVLIAVAVGAAWPLSRRVAARLRAPRSEIARRRFRPVLRRIADVAMPLLWLAPVWTGVVVATHAGWPHRLLQIVASLTSAWVVIRLATGLIRSPGWSRLVAWLAWTLAALSTLGLYEDTLALLDSMAVTLGDVRVSVLGIIKGVIALTVLLWAALAASNVFETRISRAGALTPSVQVLLGKVIKIVLVTVAVLVALDSVGIDLTALAVFGGALGVGIGFGLQRIVANLVSGLILLLDRSIKPGDVITVGETYGWITSLGARYASVRTRDGTEHLIPNEELITQRVENWSHSDRAVRLRIPIGIHYRSDVREAMALCLEAAAAVPRVLATPRTVCLLRGFGDSSVDLELRIWIEDPQNGRSNVMSDVLLGVWDRFREHGIEIPYPQRDLHLRSSAVPLGAGADPGARPPDAPTARASA